MCGVCLCTKKQCAWKTKKFFLVIFNNFCVGKDEFEKGVKWAQQDTKDKADYLYKYGGQKFSNFDTCRYTDIFLSFPAEPSHLVYSGKFLGTACGSKCW